MKRALIIGSEGQDGRILFERLAREQSVVGLGRNITRTTEGTAAAVDILQPAQMSDAIAKYRPDRIYFLAACHGSSEQAIDNEREALKRSFDVHVTALRGVLDAMITQGSAARLFYAASSHIFGAPSTPVQDEQSPLNPTTIYGMTKAAGVEVCRLYRRSHRAFASVGILYNHESGLRSESFVSQKIVSAAIRIAAGEQEKLVLGDLSSTVDWGYAPDYVDAMIRILDLPAPDDFIIGTGEPHTVREFVELAFGMLELDWKSHVVENPSLIASPKPTLVGNPQKLKAMTGWQPSVSFAQLVRLLLQARGFDH